MKTHPEPEQLSAYLDEEAEPAERAQIESHLRTCSECTATLIALRATVADLAELPSPDLSEQDSWALRSAVARARKTPANRYQRWVVATGSVAAVAIAVVAIISTRGGGGNHATRTLALANAPAATAQVGLVSVDGSNYNETSSKSLLSPTLAFGAVTAGGTESDRKSVASPAPAAASLPRQTSDTELEAFLSKIQACEQQLFENDSTVHTPVRYVVARFKNTPSFFLVYSVQSGSTTKTEMYVVQQKDCSIRLFLAPQ